MAANETITVCEVTPGDTSWVLISTILVLGMSPALAFFEAGMLRSKNTLSIVTQIFSGVITLSVMWVLFGYSLTFGPTQGGFIGGLHYGAFVDVSYSECISHAPKIPSAAFAMFQMMFAVITPLLITGAYAERMKFKVYFAFTVIWEVVVYYPVAHWIWGDGFFSTWGPVLDFAGGIVIHTSAGAASIVSAIMLGRRQEFEHYHGEFPPSNLPLAATGAALLWIGWFGFNGGSALGAGSVAVSAVVSSQVGCSMSAITWLFLAWYRDSPSTTALMNGALAGLAGITPASGYINTQASIVVGFVLGIASYIGCVVMKQKFHIDDALDVSMVHGLTGVIGSLAVGIFADKSLNPLGEDGWWYGNPAQLGYQVVGVLTVGVYAAFMTFAILKILSYVFGGLRVTEAEERMGVDWTEHKEIAYHKLHVLDDATTREYVDQHYEDHHISSDDDDVAQILQHRHNATTNGNGQLQGDAPNSVTDIVAPVPISGQLSRPLLRPNNTPSPLLVRSESNNSLPPNDYYRRKTPVPGSAPGSPQHGGVSFPPPLATSGTRGNKRGEA